MHRCTFTEFRFFFSRHSILQAKAKSTSGNSSTRLSDIPDTFCHIIGSEPEPIWVWIRLTFIPYFKAIFLTSSLSSCQIPNEELGPPTFVLPVPPLPVPGLKRIPQLPPGKSLPNVSHFGFCYESDIFYDIQEIRVNAQNSRNAFEQRSLNLILKRLINEEFQW